MGSKEKVKFYLRQKEFLCFILGIIYCIDLDGMNLRVLKLAVFVFFWIVWRLKSSVETINGVKDGIYKNYKSCFHRRSRIL